MKYTFYVIGILILLTGCSLPGAIAPTPTLDPAAIVTAAAATAYVKLTEIAGMASPTPLETATATPEPSTSTPTATVEVTLVPYDATCTANVTVRSWPGSGGEALGGIFYERSAQVLARNEKGNWFYIIWPDSPTGRAWVNSRAFKLKVDVGILPIALEVGNGEVTFLPPIVWTVTGVPLPLPTVSNDPSLRPALVIQMANLRVCPTTSCMIIGNLQYGDRVIMTGRIGENLWAQIEYPSGPDGKAWISREFIQPEGNALSGLPYFNLMGTPVTPEPPTGTPDPLISPTPANTSTPTPAGPLAEITDVTTIYTLMSSLSPELGTLNPKDKIHITAQSLNHLWFEIQYPVDTTGRAYISSKYVRLLGDFRYLNYTDANGTPLPTP